jgi:hypothetical protein
MKKKQLYAAILISILGLLAIVVPAYFTSTNSITYPDSLFPLIRFAVEKISYWSAIMLFFTGFLMKFFTSLNGWKVGLLTIALLPVITFLEIIADSSSHNLWPIEFVFYAVFSIPAIIGAC